MSRRRSKGSAVRVEGRGATETGNGPAAVTAGWERPDPCPALWTRAEKEVSGAGAGAGAEPLLSWAPGIGSSTLTSVSLMFGNSLVPVIGSLRVATAFS